MALSRRTRRQAARSAIEDEAGQTIGARIAAGRPPPGVWRAAAARRKANGLPAGAWYGLTSTSVGGHRLPPGAGTDLVLHVVRLPPM